MATNKIKIIISNRDKTFDVAEGYLLDEKVTAHKYNDEWRLTDLDSGLCIKGGFHTLKECKEFFANMDDTTSTQLTKVRQSKNYPELCLKVKEAAKELIK